MGLRLMLGAISPWGVINPPQRDVGAKHLVEIHMPDVFSTDGTVYDLQYTEGLIIGWLYSGPPCQNMRLLASSVTSISTNVKLPAVRMSSVQLVE